MKSKRIHMLMYSADRTSLNKMLYNFAGKTLSLQFQSLVDTSYQN